MVVSREMALSDLNEILRRRFNSLAGYALYSEPYITDADAEAVAVLKKIAAEEEGFAAELGRLIEGEGGIPEVGTYDEAVAEMSYLSMPYLVGLLLKDKRAKLERGEKRLAAGVSLPQVREVLKRLSEMDRRHLEELESVKHTYAEKSAKAAAAAAAKTEPTAPSAAPPASAPPKTEAKG